MLTRSLKRAFLVITSDHHLLNLISLSKFNLPLVGTFTWPTPPGPYRATTLNYGSHTYFFDRTRTWRTSPDEWTARMSEQLSAVATSETTQTWKMIHIIHGKKADMRRMMVAKLYSGKQVGLKLPDICLTGEKRPRKKPHPGNLYRPGIEPGPAAWQAAMLPPTPQQWTEMKFQYFIIKFCLKNGNFHILNFISEYFFRRKNVIFAKPCLLINLILEWRGE